MIIRLRRGPTTVLGIPFSIQESEEQSKTTSMFLGVRSTDEQAPNYKEDPSKKDFNVIFLFARIPPKNLFTLACEATSSIFI